MPVPISIVHYNVVDVPGRLNADANDALAGWHITEIEKLGKLHSRDAVLIVNSCLISSTARFWHLGLRRSLIFLTILA